MFANYGQIIDKKKHPQQHWFIRSTIQKRTNEKISTLFVHVPFPCVCTSPRCQSTFNQMIIIIQIKKETKKQQNSSKIKWMNVVFCSCCYILLSTSIHHRLFLSFFQNDKVIFIYTAINEMNEWMTCIVNKLKLCHSFKWWWSFAFFNMDPSFISKIIRMMIMMMMRESSMNFHPCKHYD